MLILIYAFDKRSLKQVLEHELELVSRIDSCRLLQRCIGDGGFNDLIKDQVIGPIAPTSTKDRAAMYKAGFIETHLACAQTSDFATYRRGVHALHDAFELPQIEPCRSTIGF
ncbi:hypothetical protein RZS28_14660 [Methylocapsa polymorpha]|uniref:Uncharacterized protein n=1 Tax=Methylocapsa polymorpha TaxID=3080828 RepID=A0ABZ0HP09_9HYPH|nr:hypothetical protein RZS28_14660 [Methylocapsa sp. RX1]